MKCLTSTNVWLAHCTNLKSSALIWTFDDWILQTDLSNIMSSYKQAITWTNVNQI